MAAKQLGGPRPSTRLGLASDVRSTDYQTRTVRSAKTASVKSDKPPKPRTAARRNSSDRRVP